MFKSKQEKLFNIGKKHYNFFEIVCSFFLLCCAYFSFSWKTQVSIWWFFRLYINKLEIYEFCINIYPSHAYKLIRINAIKIIAMLTTSFRFNFSLKANILQSMDSIMAPPLYNGKTTVAFIIPKALIKKNAVSILGIPTATP